MNAWKQYLWAALLVLLWLVPPAAGAQERKDEWKQPGYAFDSLKLVLVRTSFAGDVEADDLKQRILNDKVKKTFSLNLKFAQAGWGFLSEEQLVEQLSKSSGEDVAALAQRDPLRYEQQIQDSVPVYCQGILQVNFSVYNDTVYTIPAHIETYQTTKQVFLNRVITGADGKQTTVSEWVDVPVTDTKVVPAYDTTTAHVALEFTLLDAASNKPVWKMVDSRDAAEKGKDGMVDRILKRAAERLMAVRKPR